jgi:antitoxin component of MazEF toxin-antitoxin module
LPYHHQVTAREVVMIKKLVRHGNSRALIIDKPILDIIGATDDSEFTITTDGQSLTITPVHSAEEERRLAFEFAAEDALGRYGSTFERLSK